MGLKAGDLGTAGGFADSMAEAMEEALQEQWTALGRGTLSSVGEEDRRLMFVAIARGILKYLKDKEAEGVHLHNTMTFDRVPDPDVTETVVALQWNVDDVS